MTDIISVLDSVRAKRGLDPINSHEITDGGTSMSHIDGGTFQPEFEAARKLPPMPEPVKLDQVLEPEAEAPATGAPEADLAILDAYAVLRGKNVKLSESEVSQITGVVIRALRRVLKDELKAIGQLRPRARRKPSLDADGDAYAVLKPEVVKRKRGRPRKNPIDSTAAAV